MRSLGLFDSPYLSAVATGGASFVYRQTITIPSGTVSADLTNFTLRLTEANFDSGLWDNADIDGSQVVVTDASFNILYKEVVRFDPCCQKMILYVKVPTITAASDTTLYLFYGDGVTPQANSSQAWDANYTAVIHTEFPGGIFADSSPLGGAVTMDSNSPTYKEPRWWRWTPAENSPDVNCHQGVATVDTSEWWTFDTARIDRRNAAWAVQVSNATPLASLSGTPNHLGDGDSYNGVLYVPVERWGACPGSDYDNQKIVLYDATTLAFIEEHDISAQAHEVSSLVVEADFDRITITSYCEPKLFQYKLSDFSYLGSISLSNPSVTTIQGITRIGKDYYVGTTFGRIYRVGFDGTVWGQVYRQNPTGPVYEGLANDGTNLYWLVDGAADNGIVRKLTPILGMLLEEGYHLHKNAGTSNGNITALSWFLPFDDIQRTQIGLSVSTADRLAIVIDNGNDQGTWDSDGASWMYCSPSVDPALNTYGVVALRAASGGTRSLWYNGTQRNSGAAGAFTTTRSDLTVGTAYHASADWWLGEIAETRLSKTIRSDVWMLFEYTNLTNAGSTYSVGAEEYIINPGV